MSNTNTPISDAPAASLATTETVQVPSAPAQEMGFAHFIAQSDVVGKSLFIILVLMSLVSWSLIVIKGVALMRRQKRSKSFLNFFWNATSLEAVQHEIATHGATEPFAHLTAHAMHAQAHHARYGAASVTLTTVISEVSLRPHRALAEPSCLPTSPRCTTTTNTRWFNWWPIWRPRTRCSMKTTTPMWRAWPRTACLRATSATRWTWPFT